MTKRWSLAACVKTASLQWLCQEMGAALSCAANIKAAPAATSVFVLARRILTIACVRGTKAYSRTRRVRMQIKSNLDPRLEQTAEFPGEIHGNASVDRTLPVKEALSAAQREDPFVPDVRVDIQALAPVEAKTHESARVHVIPGERQRHIKWSAIKWEK